MKGVLLKLIKVTLSQNSFKLRLKLSLRVQDWKHCYPKGKYIPLHKLVY